MRIRRYGPVYTFKAWIDERGSNEDSRHEIWCEAPIRCLGLERDSRCMHIKLWDLNTRGKARNIVRVQRRHRPLLLEVLVGPRYWRVLRIGRKWSGRIV